MLLTEYGPLLGVFPNSLACRAGTSWFMIWMNSPKVMLLTALMGTGSPMLMGFTPAVVRTYLPGNMLVKALAASVMRPSPSGPIEESWRNCCQTGWVSQYNPAPPRITVFLL